MSEWARERCAISVESKQQKKYPKKLFNVNGTANNDSTGTVLKLIFLLETLLRVANEWQGKRVLISYQGTLKMRSEQMYCLTVFSAYFTPALNFLLAINGLFRFPTVQQQQFLKNLRFEETLFSKKPLSDCFDEYISLFDAQHTSKISSIRVMRLCRRFNIRQIFPSCFTITELSIVKRRAFVIKLYFLLCYFFSRVFFAVGFWLLKGNGEM